MSTSELKNKINKSLEEMDANNLQSAHFILRELINQQKFANANVDTGLVDTKITKGIKQLNHGEGTDFGSFLNEVQAEHGKKK